MREGPRDILQKEKIMVEIQKYKVMLIVQYFSPIFKKYKEALVCGGWPFPVSEKNGGI